MTTLEAYNVAIAWSQIITSILPFDRWYRERIVELQGIYVRREIMAKGQKNKKMIKKKPQKTLKEKRKAKKEKINQKNNDNIISQTKP